MTSYKLSGFDDIMNFKSGLTTNYEICLKEMSVAGNQTRVSFSTFIWKTVRDVVVVKKPSLARTRKKHVQKKPVVEKPEL